MVNKGINELNQNLICHEVETSALHWHQCEAKRKVELGGAINFAKMEIVH
jgi:hypothetical protein